MVGGVLVTQNSDIYEIRFPYDAELINIVKEIPGRRWNPDKKFWSIPVERLGMFLNSVKGTEYESLIKIQSSEHLLDHSAKLTSTNIPDIDVSNVPFYVKDGATPYKHQLDFMKFAIHRQNAGNMHGFILADQPGLAKTVECINLAIYNREKYGYKHCLILCCVNSAKFTWLHEIPLHTQGREEGYILGSRLKRSGRVNYITGGKEKLSDLTSHKRFNKDSEGELPYFLIMNIEAIRFRQGKEFPIADKLISMIQSGELQMIVLDEVHKNVSPSSLQGKQLLRLKTKASRAMYIPVTGTPITSSPLNAYLPLRLIDKVTDTNFWLWKQRFCVFGGFGGKEITGYKNLPILQDLMQNNMLRRLKSDVLDLPDKIIHDEYIENSTYQQKLYAHIQTEAKSQSYSNDDRIPVPDLRALMLRLRQVNGSPELVDTSLDIKSPSYLKDNAKLYRLLEILADIRERNEKVIIFSNWVQPLKTLYKYVVAQGYKTCAYTGTMSEADREQHRNVFINNPEYTVMIGTVGALGTSHTLTVANNVIFYDEPWTPADKEQAIDRIHRIGTQGSIHIYTLMSQDTVDDVVHNILYKKSMYSDFLVDTNIDQYLYDNPLLVNQLLGV